jgi:hypothetical protein
MSQRDRNEPTFCDTTADIPQDRHYAIITDRSISIPGDERSRQFPGHGYPASTEHVFTYTVYPTFEAWVTEIEDRERRGYKNFRAVQVTPARVETEIKVTVAVEGDNVSPYNHEYCPHCRTLTESIARDGLATRTCVNGHHWLPAEGIFKK